MAAITSRTRDCVDGLTRIVYLPEATTDQQSWAEDQRVRLNLWADSFGVFPAEKHDAVTRPLESNAEGVRIISQLLQDLSFHVERYHRALAPQAASIEQTRPTEKHSPHEGSPASKSPSALANKPEDDVAHRSAGDVEKGIGRLFQLAICIQEGAKATQDELVDYCGKSTDDALKKYPARQELFAAVQSGAVEKLTALLKTGLSANTKNSEDCSALQLAAKHGHLECVRCLLEAGADVNYHSRCLGPALRLAVYKEQVGIVALLIENHADLNLCITGQTRQDGSDLRYHVQGTPLHAACITGNIEIARLLLEKGDNLVDHDCILDFTTESSELGMTSVADGISVTSWRAFAKTESISGTPLALAIRAGHIEIAELLMDRYNVSVDSHMSWTPKNTFPGQRPLPTKRNATALCWASLTDNAELVKCLLGHGAAVDHTDTARWSPLMYAAYGGSPRVIKTLLDEGANASHKNADGETVFHFAVNSCMLDCAKILFERDNEIDCRNRIRATPLMTAIRKSAKDVTNGTKWLEIVKWLLTHEASLTACDYQGNRAIHYAINHSNSNMVQLILDHDIDLCAEHLAGETPIMRAARRDLELVRRLVNQGVFVDRRNKDGTSGLSWAVKEGHVEAAHRFIDSGANIEQADADDCGNSPLMSAARRGNIEITTYLLDKGAKTDARNVFGATALMLAAQFQSRECVRQLLLSGASIDQKDRSGATALLYAIRQDWENSAIRKDGEVLQALVDARATLPVKDKEGRTPLELAVNNKLVESMDILVQAGALAGLALEVRHRALLLAAGSGKLACLRALLNFKPDPVSPAPGSEVPVSPNVRSSDSLTPLMAAAAVGSLECIEALIQAGALLDLRDHEGRTAIFHACMGPTHAITGSSAHLPMKRQDRSRNHAQIFGTQIDVLRLLLNHGASTSVRDHKGQTLLISAVSAGADTATVGLLLQYNKVNEPDKEKMTVLHHAVTCSSGETVKLLISLGADLFAKASRGQTPLMIAAHHGRRDQTEALLEVATPAYINLCHPQFGLNALAIALLRDHGPVVERLVQKGASLIDVIDKVDSKHLALLGEKLRNGDGHSMRASTLEKLRRFRTKLQQKQASESK